MKIEKLKESVLKNTQQIFENLTWLTTEETAQYLRTSVNAIRIAVHRKQIRARKFGKRLLFKRCELDEIIETSFY